MARLNPEVAVFIMGANDWTTPRSTPVDASGEPAWKAEYATRVEAMVRVLEGTGDDPRPVYWVGSPTLQDKKKDAGAREVNTIARAVVARHPSATYVDAYQLFSSPTGTYTATLAGPDGTSGARAHRRRRAPHPGGRGPARRRDLRTARRGL